MTDSQNNDVEGLPTAVYSFVVKDAELDPDENHKVVKWSDPRNSNSIEGIRHKDHTVKDVEELVRRKDVKTLIKNHTAKIKNHMNLEEDDEASYWLNLLKKELLEELEGESDE